jgi:4-hydroxybenzoate polyprenyltransferase
MFLSFLTHPIPALIASMGSILLYWGGMVLNDVFDLDEDQLNQRPGPIVRGAISLGTATLCGWSMLFLGSVLACIAAVAIHGSVASVTWTATVAFLLVGAIVCYDGPLKKTPLAPAVMGSCRGLNMCLGMAIAAGAQFTNLPSHAWLYPIGYGIYVMGFTIAARKEFLTEQSRTRLWAGWLISLAGILLLAWTIWRFPPTAVSKIIERRGSWSQWFFPGVMVLLSVPVFRRALASIQSLRGPDLGQAIRTAIINILFIQATISLIHKGPWEGLLIAMLIVPTILLARYFRST